MNNINLKAAAELVEKMQNGDAEAFAEIYKLYASNIYYLCLKFVKNETDAEDLMQEVFISIYRNIGSLQEPTAFDHWIYVSAVNRAKDYLKKLKPLLISEIESSDGDTSEIDTLFSEDTKAVMKSPFDIVAEKEVAKKLNELIDELPDGQRIAVMHFYFGGLTIAEIAELEGITEGAVKNRLYLAREALNKKAVALEKDGYKLRAVLPFLPLVLGEAAKSINVPESVSASIFTAIGGATTAASISDAAASTATATAGASAKAGLFASLGRKIVAGAVAAALLTGGIFTSVHFLSNIAHDLNTGEISDAITDPVLVVEEVVIHSAIYILDEFDAAQTYESTMSDGNAYERVHAARGTIVVFDNGLIWISNGSCSGSSNSEGVSIKEADVYFFQFPYRLEDGRLLIVIEDENGNDTYEPLGGYSVEYKSLNGETVTDELTPLIPSDCDDYLHYAQDFAEIINEGTMIYDAESDAWRLVTSVNMSYAFARVNTCILEIPQ